MRIISAFSDDITAIEMLLTRNAGEMHLPRWLLWWQRTSSYHTKTKWRMRAHAGRTRWLPWQRRTPSWEAAYNAACLYAALAGSGWYRQNEKDLKDPMVSAVNSLERVVNDRRCEMERPWDWISKDPDLNYLNNNSPRFREFVRDQGQKDYPRANFEPTVNARAGLPAPDDPLVHTRQASLQNHDKAAQQSLPNSVVSAEP